MPTLTALANKIKHLIHTHFPHIHMTSKKLLTIIGSSLTVLAISGGAIVFASRDQSDADHKRLAQLESEISETKKQYQDLAGRKEKNQSFCTLAATQAQQMNLLNGLNNQRRDEIKFLQSKLTPTPPRQ